MTLSGGNHVSRLLLGGGQGGVESWLPTGNGRKRQRIFARAAICGVRVTKRMSGLSSSEPKLLDVSKARSV